MEYFLPDTYILRTQRHPDGQIELTLSRDAGLPDISDILIGSTDTWKVTEVLRDSADIRVRVQRA
ncbi:hypothetical protein [Deinococcus hopiensis]|uniref:Uncharacterized protein n=1 Tax=Deinococcus hopiensis KR-140 TaxID=695939 RepID=A0A1W1VIZ3_9DEIO|nr:hypothetical protein [Deinococcus hopiensis]SMB93355.1 hypothetical protein SAMN00790413_01949 [Deinococcus hopiensis KR-140]